MKQRFFRQVAFMGKSLLWSALFYVAVMLVVYKEDISNTIAGKQPIAVTTNTPLPQIPRSTDQATAKHTRAVKNLVAIIKTISGCASILVCR